MVNIYLFLFCELILHFKESNVSNGISNINANKGFIVLKFQKKNDITSHFGRITQE